MFARWMDGFNDVKGERVQICSKCHTKNLGQPDICPSCGSYMVKHQRTRYGNTGRYPWPEKVLQQMYYEQNA